MADLDDSKGIFFESSVVEARRLILPAVPRDYKHCTEGVVGEAGLGDGVVTESIDGVLVKVEGEYMELPVEMTVSTCIYEKKKKLKYA